MSSVVQAQIVKGSQTCFQILFNQEQTNELLNVEYEAASNVDRDHIIEKINFLVGKNCKP